MAALVRVLKRNFSTTELNSQAARNVLRRRSAGVIDLDDLWLGFESGLFLINPTGPGSIIDRSDIDMSCR
jgi:hypothetical protein